MKLRIRKKLDAAMLMTGSFGIGALCIFALIAAFCLLTLLGMKVTYAGLQQDQHPMMYLSFTEHMLLCSAAVYIPLYLAASENVLLRSSPYGRYAETVLPSRITAFILLADMLFFADIMRTNASDNFLPLLIVSFCAVIFEILIPYILKNILALLISVTAFLGTYPAMKNLFYAVNDISFSLVPAVILSAVMIIAGAWAGGKIADKMYLMPVVLNGFSLNTAKKT